MAQGRLSIHGQSLLSRNGFGSFGSGSNSSSQNFNR